MDKKAQEITERGDLHLYLLKLAQGDGLKIPWLCGGNSQKVVNEIYKIVKPGLPKDKPPLLSDEDCIIVWGSGKIKYEFRVGTEVRRRLLLTDVAGIEREFTIIINDEKGIRTMK